MAAPTLEELPACPVETTLSLIGNKWQVLILRDLVLNGTMRFKELQRSIGKISQKVLTSNLRTMEDAGLVHREVFPEVPPRVEYSLPETGETVSVGDVRFTVKEMDKNRIGKLSVQVPEKKESF